MLFRRPDLIYAGCFEMRVYFPRLNLTKAEADVKSRKIFIKCKKICFGKVRLLENYGRRS